MVHATGWHATLHVRRFNSEVDDPARLTSKTYSVVVCPSGAVTLMVTRDTEPTVRLTAPVATPLFNMAKPAPAFSSSYTMLASACEVLAVRVMDATSFATARA